MVNPFLILGLDESASDMSIAAAYKYLSENLQSKNFAPDSLDQEQAQRCLARITTAFRSLQEPAALDMMREQIKAEIAQGNDREDMKPFLGHICVAAGIITIDELNDAVKKQGDIDLPLGQILQEKALLSQTELDGLLMGQRLFGSSGRPMDPMTRRLLSLDAVSRDMVKIVMIDQRTNFVNSLPELLVMRGWLSNAVHRVLEDQTNQISV